MSDKTMSRKLDSQFAHYENTYTCLWTSYLRIQKPNTNENYNIFLMEILFEEKDQSGAGDSIIF